MHAGDTALQPLSSSRSAGALRLDAQWPVDLAGQSTAAQRAREETRAAVEADRVLVIAGPGLDAAAVARLMHEGGPSRDGPLVAIDCAAAEGRELEAMLFGRSAAQPSRASRGLDAVEAGSAFDRAFGGTLFLANVQELPTRTQRRLARVLRDGQVRVGGAGRIRSLDLMLVASGPPSLEDDVAEGRFREDLHRRLSIRRVHVPALRERPEDLSEIVRHLQARPFTRAALALLAALPWEGNLDELREVILALENEDGTPVRVEDLLAHLPLARRVTARGASLREARRQFEREYVAAVLREHDWRIPDAARALGMQRTNLYRKARQLNIRRGKVSR